MATTPCRRLDGPIAWEQKRRLVEILVAGVRVDTTETCGVKQSAITVTYRFSQPDALPLVLPQSYSTGRVVRIPTPPQTVGDHIRLKRLGLKMIRRDLAEQMGVNMTSIANWESNRMQPDHTHMPAVIRFLGYNPLPEAKTLAEQLIRHRTILGLSQNETAKELGVDPSTLAKWERGERVPTGAFLERVKEFLRIVNGGVRRAG